MVCVGWKVSGVTCRKGGWVFWVGVGCGGFGYFMAGGVLAGPQRSWENDVFII